MISDALSIITNTCWVCSASIQLMFHKEQTELMFPLSWAAEKSKF